MRAMLRFSKREAGFGIVIGTGELWGRAEFGANKADTTADDDSFFAFLRSGLSRIFFNVSGSFGHDPVVLFKAFMVDRGLETCGLAMLADSFLISSSICKPAVRQSADCIGSYD